MTKTKQPYTCTTNRNNIINTIGLGPALQSQTVKV